MSVKSPASALSEHLIRPRWPAPANVKAVITTRGGGCSAAPYDSNNLGLHVGDQEADVLENRQLLLAALGLRQPPQWLEQIHGAKVVEALPDGLVRTADGCYSHQPGVACVVMTADCLPVLLCDRQGRQVAAAHAGWRGLAKGILASTVESFAADPATIMAYLGPAISVDQFEVGIEVLEAYCESARSQEQLEAITAAFRPSMRPLHFYADIYALARAELAALGVRDVYGGDYCTYSEVERFYSYRRESQTGRMASLIWLV